MCGTRWHANANGVNCMERLEAADMVIHLRIIIIRSPLPRSPLGVMARARGPLALPCGVSKRQQVQA